MDSCDQNIRQKLCRELEHVRLGSQGKKALKKAVRLEMAARPTGVKRVFREIKCFWESTYEINLAPVAAVAVVLLLAGVAATGPGTPASKVRPDRMVYVQETAGGAGGAGEIVFIPVER